MKSFVGCKIIKARLSNLEEYKQIKYGDNSETKEGDIYIKGYIVYYPALKEPGGDSYVSFSPKIIFETCYREIDVEEFRLINDYKI